MQEQQPVQKRIDSIKVLSFFPETWANQQELDRFSRHGKKDAPSTFHRQSLRKKNKKVSQTSRRKAPAKKEGTRRRIYRIESTNGKAAEDDDDEPRQKKDAL